MKEIKIVCFNNGTAQLTTGDTHFDNENLATRLEIDFSKTDYSDKPKWVDIIVNKTIGYRYELGTDEIVSMLLTSSVLVNGEMVITPIVYDGELKVKYRPNYTVGIIDQQEAIDVEPGENSDFIFQLKARMDELENTAIKDFDDLETHPTTLEGYGITDVYDKTEIGVALDLKADNTTVSDLDLATEKLVNKKTTLAESSDVDYPTVKAVKDGLDLKVDKVEGETLTPNKYTDEEKTRLTGIEDGAQINIIEKIKIDGVDLTPDVDKIITLPNKEPAFEKNTAFNKNFGNKYDTVCEGNDVRLSDKRTPFYHTHGNINGYGEIGTISSLMVQTGPDGLLTTIAAGTTAQYLRGDGQWWTPNTEPAFTKNTAFNKNFGDEEDTVCEGDDARLSDARTPLSHTHGNITNDGKIGTSPDRIIVTGTGGLLTTKDLGKSGEFSNSDGEWETPPDTVYTHPSSGANKTITAADGKVLSSITVDNLGHTTAIDSKTLVATDIPNLDTSKLTAGTLGIARGGTGRTDGYAVGVVETRASVLTKIWTGTQAQYDAIGTKDANTLYFIM